MRASVCLVVMIACGRPAAELEAQLPSQVTTTALSRCELMGHEQVSAVAASRDAVALATRGVVERFAGVGCELQRDGSFPVALGALLDADDLGNLYGRPAASMSRGVLSTAIDDLLPSGAVVKVDTEAVVTPVVSAGRGIWSFGVSPGGGSFWVTACGPNGIFSTGSMPLTQVLEPPDTLWEQQANVLTDEATFWSVGTRTCSPLLPLTASCGFELVRTTAAGSVTVGSALIDLGSGLEVATLARCGDLVCGVLPRGVTVWNGDGTVRQTILAAAGEQIVQASGNRHGVYLVVRDAQGSRVVFEPLGE